MADLYEPGYASDATKAAIAAPAILLALNSSFILVFCFALIRIADSQLISGILIFTAIETILFVGAIQMLRRQWYYFSVVVCLLSCLLILIPFLHLIFIIGAVVGFWGLIVLGSPEAMIAFKKPVT